MEGTLKRIEEKLAAIESLLQQMPVIQAIASIRLNEEYQSAKLTGKSSKDLWELELHNLP